ncbi:MAG: hypothetical protein ABIO71_03780, partial [Caldimonas sp.]
LPAPFGLATVYSAGVARGAQDAALARRFVAMLAGPESAALRRAGGFATANGPAESLAGPR